VCRARAARRAGRGPAVAGPAAAAAAGDALPGAARRRRRVAHGAACRGAGRLLGRAAVAQVLRHRVHRECASTACGGHACVRAGASGTGHAGLPEAGPYGLRMGGAAQQAGRGAPASHTGTPASSRRQAGRFPGLDASPASTRHCPHALQHDPHSSSRTLAHTLHPSGSPLAVHAAVGAAAGARPCVAERRVAHHG